MDERKMVTSIVVFRVFSSTLGSDMYRRIYVVDYICHAYVRADGLSGVVISNQDYPHRVAHTLITKVRRFYSSVRLQ